MIPSAKSPQGATLPPATLLATTFLSATILSTTPASTRLPASAGRNRFRAGTLLRAAAAIAALIALASVNPAHAEPPGSAAAFSASDPKADTALFDGKSLAGWSLVTQSGADITAVCTIGADGVLAVAGKPVGYLLAPGAYTNYRFHAEWRWPATAAKSSNSGFLIHIDSGPIDRGTWPRCFQVQTKLNRAGDLLPMADAAFADALTTPPGAKTPQLDRRQPSSEKPLGEWNTCDVVCRDGTLECTINGVAQNKVSGCKPASGRIGIQLEGQPYELRNVRIGPAP